MTDLDLAEMLDEHDTLRLQLLFARHFLNFERKIMSELDTLAGDIATLKAEEATNALNVASLVTLCNNIYTALQNLQATGLTPAQIAQVQAMEADIAAVTTGLQGEDTTIAATIAADTAAPAPAPAPPAA